MIVTNTKDRFSLVFLFDSYTMICWDYIEFAVYDSSTEAI